MTATEKCKNGTQYHQIKEGLVWKAIAPGCELSTRDCTFRSLEDIDLSENNFQREILTTKFGFLAKKTDTEIQDALRELQDMRGPGKINVDQLESWIKERERNSWSDGTNWAMTGFTGLAGILAVTAILFPFVKYKLSLKANEKVEFANFWKCANKEK